MWPPGWRHEVVVIEDSGWRYTMYSQQSFLVLRVEESTEFMDSWPQFPLLVSQIRYKSHTHRTVADQLPRFSWPLCLFGNISTVLVVHYPPISFTVFKYHAVYWSAQMATSSLVTKWVWKHLDINPNSSEGVDPIYSHGVDPCSSGVVGTMLIRIQSTLLPNCSPY